jgi:hypothetical protein
VSANFSPLKSESNPVLKPEYPKFIPAEPLLAAVLGRNNDPAGWGLRCGDDGSEWSRGKSPSPPKPRLLAHPDPVSRPGFRFSRFARRLNRLELVLRPNQCAVSISRAKSFEISPREEVTTGDQAPWADSWKRNRTEK